MCHKKKEVRESENEIVEERVTQSEMTSIYADLNKGIQYRELDYRTLNEFF